MVNIILYTLIAVLGVASYAVGVQQMLTDRYSPSVFSRVIWVLLAVNSFAGVVLSGGSASSILLGGILLLGNIAICVVSFWKGTREIGAIEYVCILLLVSSIFIWIFSDAPLLNLSLSLFAHFIGGVPTYKKVLKDSRSESTAFWSLFFFASLLSVFTSEVTSLRSIVLPVYFVIFDGSMTLLTLRKLKYASK